MNYTYLWYVYDSKSLGISIHLWNHTTNKLVNQSFVPFCLFILFMGISWQEYWNGLLFPPPVGHVLSELFTLTHLSWVTLHGMPHWIMQAPLPGQGCDLWRGSFKKRWQEYTEELYKKRSNDLGNLGWCGHSPRAGRPGVWSQVGLRKHYYEQGWWRWWNFSWVIWNPKR